MNLPMVIKTFDADLHPMPLADLQVTLHDLHDLFNEN